VLATYDFPVKPGTADWKAFGTHLEMLNACRIPEKVLTQLSTEGLIETMLNYPLLFEIFAFNTPQQGIDAVTAQFNGFQELFARDDRCARLINKYESMDIRPQIDGLSAVAQVEYIWRVSVLEMIMAQQPVSSALSPSQINDLLTISLDKVAQKRAEADLISNGEQTTAWLISRTLQLAGYQPFLEIYNEDEYLPGFVSTGFAYNDYSILFTLAEQYLTDHSR
jgi:hypothetical protein